MLGIVPDVHQAAHGHDQEPEGGDRPEEGGHAGRAEPLDGKQADQDHEAERHHVGIEGGRHQLEALDRREDRDGWRDDGIAVEQRGARPCRG